MLTGLLVLWLYSPGQKLDEPIQGGVPIMEDILYKFKFFHSFGHFSRNFYNKMAYSHEFGTY